MISYFRKDLPKNFSEGLLVFNSNLMQSLNFMYENLVMFRNHNPKTLPEQFSKLSLPDIYLKNTRIIESYHLEIPEIKVAKRRKGYYKNEYPRKLFYNSIVQIVSDFEIYIKDVLDEIFTLNEELLALDEKQISSREIIECDNIDDLKNILIDIAVMKFTQASYPTLVEMFQRKLHIGLHKKKGQISKFEMHHFIETRNIIIHNNAGHNSYFQDRMKPYGLPSPLDIGKQRHPKVDFEYIYKFSKKLYNFVCFIDNELAQKWDINLRSLKSDYERI